MQEPNYNTDDNNIRFIIESALAKLEKANTRLWVVVIILIVALLGTNAGWIYYESQWQYVQTSTEVTQTSETSGEGNTVIYDGVHINGESESNDNTND